VIVLAAGEGTRMKSSLPKVLHKISGRTILEHLLNAVSEVESKEVRVVVGAGSQEVTEALSTFSKSAKLVLQDVRRGTGDAVRIALADSPATGTVLVCAGDTPLLTSQTLKSLVESHSNSGAAATVLTAELPDPFGYGRIVKANGELISIVEERDATNDEREITEINSGVYLFDIAAVRDSLTKLDKKNAQGEEYLTDAIAILRKVGKSVGTYLTEDFTEILGVNDRSQLADVSALLRDRINEALMLSGVTIVDSAGAVIGPRTTLIDCEVGDAAQIIESHCESSKIGSQAKVGPYAHLRSGTVLAGYVKVGSFVETKNAHVGEGSKVPHLSYVGDAVIGKETNIGAATIFVNYDGVDKHQTKVGDHVRIGSDSMLIAPVTIGDGAYTAAGSVINEDVPPGALGIGRARQVNILGWVLKKRKGSKSANAAEEKK
jgi:bifunctional UDP-N-acetylglucosamine pyrophosphorylase/glucosamine-1-phosphate N-acetyltransferase